MYSRVTKLTPTQRFEGRLTKARQSAAATGAPAESPVAMVDDPMTIEAHDEAHSVLETGTEVPLDEDNVAEAEAIAQ